MTQRQSEQIALLVSDCDIAHGNISVSNARVMARDRDRTKTSTDRLVEPCPRALQELKRHLALRARLQLAGKIQHEDLFFKETGEPIRYLLVGKNPLWVAKTHCHSVQTVLASYAAWTEGAQELDVEPIRVAMAGAPERVPQSLPAIVSAKAPKTAPISPLGSQNLGVEIPQVRVSYCSTKRNDGGEREGSTPLHRHLILKAIFRRWIHVRPPDATTARCCIRALCSLSTSGRHSVRLADLGRILLRCATGATLILMKSRIITQRELRNQSGAVLREVEAGRTIIVSRNGTPVGELRPIRRRRFVPRAAIADAAGLAARIDAAQFRADLDAVVDPHAND